MDVRDCGLGIVKPDFYNIDDLSGISHAFCRDGLVFVDGCNEESLVKLGGHFGQIVKPRNETSTGTGVSNIRAAPGLVGKGYSSEGKHRSSPQSHHRGLLVQNYFSTLIGVAGRTRHRS